MGKLYFVTSNEGKILRAKEQLSEYGIDIDWLNHDCAEPNVNDISYIAKYKVLEAYNLIHEPCFVVDSGFYIDNYPGESGFPGAFPKRAIVKTDGDLEGIIDLLQKMENINNRECRFVDCLTYYDGTQLKVFYGVTGGTLSYEKRGIPQVKAKSDLWYVFIPTGANKTLAEMTDEERNIKKDPRYISAILEFGKWYSSINPIKPSMLKLERED